MSVAVRPWLRAVAIALAIGFFASQASSAADPSKVLRVAFEADETGFDPVKITDGNSLQVIQVVFERLLSYDYLARPMKLAPSTAEALPEITDDGRTYTFRLRKGITFQPDPAFKGIRRELTAADYAYSIKRLMDPANHSPWRYLVEGKIVGLDDLARKAAQTRRFDYDAKVPGLEIVDRYTLRIRLARTDFNFAYTMAIPPTSGVAREVIEAYPDDSNAHPVGTGPFVLKGWTRREKVVLDANPDYREVIWDFAPASDPRDQLAVAAMKGKRVPQIDRVEIRVIHEEQARWLAFQRGEIDYIDRFESFAPIAITDGQLAPDLASRGITLDRSLEPEINYYFFNMTDPVVGGYSKEKIALRRALILSYDMAEEIRVIRKGQAIENQMPIPASVVGHDPTYRSILGYDPDLANALLDHFGYKKGPDGYRNDPSGKSFTIMLTSPGREYDELWKKSLVRIGVRFETRKGTFSDNIKAANACQLAMWGGTWGADYPDGENFMQLLYGPHGYQSNNACYQSASFDEMYVRMKNMPDSPERNQLFLLMSRQMEVDGVWKLGVSRYRNVLVHPQVKGYRYHPINQAVWPYLDIDPSARKP
jgi:ABC-type transport system substrate-binding protein